MLVSLDMDTTFLARLRCIQALTDCESQSPPDIATVVMMNILGSEDCASHVRILNNCIAIPLRSQDAQQRMNGLGPFHHATELLD